MKYGLRQSLSIDQTDNHKDHGRMTLSMHIKEKKKIIFPHQQPIAMLEVRKRWLSNP